MLRLCLDCETSLLSGKEDAEDGLQAEALTRTDLYVLFINLSRKISLLSQEAEDTQDPWAKETYSHKVLSLGVSEYRNKRATSTPSAPRPKQITKALRESLPECRKHKGM